MNAYERQMNRAAEEAGKEVRRLEEQLAAANFKATELRFKKALWHELLYEVDSLLSFEETEKAAEQFMQQKDASGAWELRMNVTEQEAIDEFAAEFAEILNTEAADEEK